MARFDSAIALAQRLIEKNGETATIRRRVDGTPPDANKPWEPGTPTDDDHETSAVFLDHSVARAAGIILKEGQQAVFVPASELGTFVPNASIDNLVRASGEKWTIEEVETLNPNGQLIMHTLKVKK